MQTLMAEVRNRKRHERYADAMERYGFNRVECLMHRWSHGERGGDLQVFIDLRRDRWTINFRSERYSGLGLDTFNMTMAEVGPQTGVFVFGKRRRRIERCTRPAGEGSAEVRVRPRPACRGHGRRPEGLRVRAASVAQGRVVL
jgi:hypothetical protein